MGKPDGKGGGKGDGRFAAMHSDPRFQRFPKQKNKVEIDNRFAGMFQDPEFQTRSAVDKRGRQVESKRRNEDLRRYYRLKDEDEWRQAAGGAKEEGAEGAEEGSEGDAGGGAVQARDQQRPLLQAAAALAEKAAVKAKANGAAAAGAPAKKLPVAAATPAAGAKAKAGQQQMKEQTKEVEEEEEGEEDQEEGAGEDGSDGEQSGSEDEEEAKARERWARARGMLGSDSSDEGEGEAEEYDSADEPLTDEELGSADEALDPQEWGAGANALNPDEDIPPQDETRRLALVDLDWDAVRAVDILAVLRSFVPASSTIERVTVYPSDFGLQRMAEEAAMGPKCILKPAALGTKEQTQPAGKGSKGGKADAADDEGSEVDRRRLAAYEKSRLRYYYAIVECDCVATALHLYNECDGLEFERSACKFDLRFVPDDQSFEGRQVRDSASTVPSDYTPPATFNISLQHTDPKLSWDAEDPERKRKLQGRRLKTDDELMEADFAAYLGSESEDEGDAQEGVGTGRGGEEDAEAIRARYRALLLGGADGAAVKDDEEAVDSDYEEEELKPSKPAGAKKDGKAATAGGLAALKAVAAQSAGRTGGKSWGADDEEGSEEEEADEAARRRGEPSTSGKGAAVATAAGGKRPGAKGRGDVDMVVTFHSGLEGLGERLKKKKEEERAKAGETVWEAYLRKKREKRALRKAQGRLRNLSDSEDSEDYISGDDEEGAGGAKYKGKAREKAGKGSKDKCGSEEASDDDLHGGDVPSDDPFSKRVARAGGRDGDGDPFNDPFFEQDEDIEAAAAGFADDSDEDGEGGAGGKGRDRAKPVKGKTKAGKDKAAAKADAAQRADLELLLMDDAALRGAARGEGGRVLPAGHDAGGGAAGRKLTKKEKREAKKEAKRKARAGSDEEDAAGGEAAPGFDVNLSDPRFGAMFESADFALDPTDPRFKKMQARDKVLQEVTKRRSEGEREGRARAPGAKGEQQEQVAKPGGKEGGELRAMVAKLKRKAEAAETKQRDVALNGGGPKKARL
ncbi:hypothetical protein HYH03_018414 [Edaphochlamys debaryana]|uniref:NUC153 domain-containing protein n=1 Tax=Edaphochlamys debaryana TaxID=47281 RepID=A0A836BPF3_9CHLO|nr:hypothetical protein HYH03_018414 [Edaphochlamys debaryana]|eukprot:KAG2482679.1 hypothetical protein HYH03_018414 [Edaphochlamys debaryana]